MSNPYDPPTTTNSATTERFTFARVAVSVLSLVMVAIGVTIAVIVTGDVWSDVNQRISTQPAEFTKQSVFYFGLWVASFGFATLCLAALTRSSHARKLTIISLVYVLPVLIVIASIAGNW